jgi:hypothetical protein
LRFSGNPAVRSRPHQGDEAGGDRRRRVAFGPIPGLGPVHRSHQYQAKVAAVEARRQRQAGDQDLETSLVAVAHAEQLARFRATSAGRSLARDCGGAIAQRLGAILARWNRLCEQLSDDDTAMADDFYRLRLTPAERASVLRVLAT